MKKTLHSLCMLVLLGLGVSLHADSAHAADQGAPGYLGPWGVYVVPAPSTIYSKASATYVLTPAAVGAAVCSNTVETLTGASVGGSCALATPTLNVNLTASCIAGTNQVTIRICNPTVAPITPAAGNYTTVVF